MEYEKLVVRLGDLVPGTHWHDGGVAYFPELGWAPYENTFRLLIDRPDATGEELPLAAPWRQWCLNIFGREPSQGDDPCMGIGWAFADVEARARELLAGFQARGGFDASLDPGAEAIRVIIQGDGSICVVQGNKRVALARVMHGLDFEIEVNIHERSRHWRRIREILTTLGGGREELYQPLPHPDFGRWAVTQPCVERLGMMNEWLGAYWSGSVLDIGCHTGYFVRDFDRRGRATGIEINRQVIEVAEAMSAFRHDGECMPRYVCGHAGDWLSASNETFDVCLCLSIVMHMFRKDGADSAWNQLRMISERAPVMFLDCVWGGYAEHLPFTIETIGKEILARTQYTEWRQLGWTRHEHRPFYVFTRKV